MEPNDEVQEYLELSDQYLRTARRAAEDGLLAPARLSLHQALELAIKAALIARTRTSGEDWAIHNVHGAFGRHFRGHVPDPDLGRISRLVQEYGRSRYPGWEAPSEPQMQDDLRFVEALLHDIVPRLIREVC